MLSVYVLIHQMVIMLSVYVLIHQMVISQGCTIRWPFL